MAIQRSSTTKRWLVGVASVGAAALMAACGPASEPTADGVPGQDPSISQDPAATTEVTTDDNTVVDVAASDDDFSILVQAVEAAGLGDALATSESITLFAPTNEAFEALPEGTLDQLLLPENQDLLRQVLSYHVVQQEVPSSEVTTGEVPSAAGAPIALQVDEATGEVRVNQATVITPDIQASNGVIHAIDQVILPPGLSL
jgi:uncharacterized surface protein with fasciclin (FAS1) repeats